LLLPERIHGRCEAVVRFVLLRLFELQTSEPQPTCTRSRAVKRLLAVAAASSKEVGSSGFGLLGAIGLLLFGEAELFDLPP